MAGEASGQPLGADVERGDVDSWVERFLEAVSTRAADAVRRAERLVDLRERCRTAVRTTTRGAASQLAEPTIEQPVLTTRFVEERLGITRPAALKALRHVEDVGIVVAATEGPRRQLRRRADEVLSVLSDGI